MAGKLPKSQKIKRSHFKTADEYCAALSKRRDGEPESVWRNRCRRAEKYMSRVNG